MFESLAAAGLGLAGIALMIVGGVVLVVALLDMARLIGRRKPEKKPTCFGRRPKGSKDMDTRGCLECRHYFECGHKTQDRT